MTHFSATPNFLDPHDADFFTQRTLSFRDPADRTAFSVAIHWHLHSPPPGPAPPDSLSPSRTPAGWHLRALSQRNPILSALQKKRGREWGEK